MASAMFRRRHAPTTAPSWLFRSLDLKHLEQEEEAGLFRHWRETGDQTALDKVVQTNMRAIYNIACRYAWSGIAIEDLMQTGVEGVMRGVGKYDPDRGVRFAVYAQWWASGAIRGLIARNRGAVAFPPSAPQYKAMFSSAESQYGHQSLLPVSLEETITENEDVSRKDLLEDDAPTAEDVVAASDGMQRLQAVIATCTAALQPREREIYVARNLREPRASLEELAKQLGISRQRVQQIDSAAAQKFKAALLSCGVNEMTVHDYL